MGFRKLINGAAFLNAFKNIQHVKTSKMALLLFAALTFFGANAAMAQDKIISGAPVSGGAATTPDDSAMWTTVTYYVLAFLVLCFCIAVIGKILKVYDLSKRMQGKRGINWNNIMGLVCLIFLIGGLYGTYWSLTVQGSVKLPVAASAHGGAIDDMFNLTTVLTLIVFFLTQIALFGFAFYYRGSEKRKGYYYPHNNTIEKIWTVVPAIVLTILVVFGFFTWQNVMDSTERTGDLNIGVTGHQFAWELRYPGPDGKLGAVKYNLVTPNNNLGVDYSDRNSFDDIHADTLVLPVNQPIRLNIMAQDVIHSVYLPQFRVQLNAVPGLPTFFRFTPTITTEQMRNHLNDPNFEYLLYCNKICGGIHYNMQKVVRVVSMAEYQDWIAHQKPYLTPALKAQLKMAAAKNSQVSANKLALNN